MTYTTYTHVQKLEHLANYGRVTEHDTVLIEDGEICDHLLSVLLYPNIRRIGTTYGAVDYMFSVYTPGRIDAGGEIMRIINNHLAGDRDVLMCQDELIDAGYAQWANL